MKTQFQRAAAAAATLLLVSAAGAAAQEGKQDPPRGAPVCDPSFAGKYQTMLRRISVPGDVRQYGACKDYGRWSGNSYRGYRNLPNGYWTYAAPYWYIWETKTR